MHITVYHSMVELPGVVPISESILEGISASETRFMVMTGGGEAPRPGVRPGSKPVGVRIHPKSPSYLLVQSYRQRLVAYETAAVLGPKRQSTHNRSALAASPDYQPHMLLLRAQSPIPDDLKVVGARWREQIGELTFDTFLVDVSRL
jgi:hypothetical protein